MLSTIISQLRKQSFAMVATIPFFIYFTDEYYSITYVKGASMEPTIHHGDIVLIRKRDAGSFLLSLLDSIGYLKSSSSSSDKRRHVDDGKENLTSPKQYSCDDDDRIQALRYRLENSSDNTSGSTNSFYWLISPSYLSPLILPGHVVVYKNPYRSQESVVKRAIGVGGQRIATRTAKRVATSTLSIQLPNDILINSLVSVKENSSIHTPSSKEDSAESPSSDYPSLLQHLRQKQQERKALDEYYDLRLPPHFIYTEDDNRTTLPLTDDSTGSYMVQHIQPVSQNLIIGIAEYIIWPPSRFQRILRQPVYETITIHNNNYNSISRPRAIWD